MRIFFKYCFKVPFPVLSFCPDLVVPPLQEKMHCVLGHRCTFARYNELLAEITSIYAAAIVCYSSSVEALATSFQALLRGADYRNSSITDRLEHSSNTEWSNENSFCMNGHQNLSPTEAYASHKGLCFIIHNGNRIFNQKL